MLAVAIADYLRAKQPIFNNVPIPEPVVPVELRTSIHVSNSHIPRKKEQ